MSDLDLARAAYIDPTARLFGVVSLGEGSSVWPYAVVRAEKHAVIVGAYSNLQDGVIIHIGGKHGTRVGEWCSIGHRATLHGATVEDNCIVGVGATLMDGVVIGRNSIVAGHAFLPEGTVIPPNSVVMGMPGKAVRQRNNFVRGRMNAFLYWQNALAYARGEHRAWSDPAVNAAVAAERKRLQALEEAAE
jgi:carbonic anhydrase/acetyltransferase-like protein (isoleucine patch superfamily)